MVQSALKRAGPEQRFGGLGEQPSNETVASDPYACTNVAAASSGRHLILDVERDRAVGDPRKALI